jgi:tetratricopeptide (TPR) repeat protein
MLKRNFRNFFASLGISHKSRTEWLNEGIAHYNTKRYEDALRAYEQAIKLDPGFALAYNGKGNVLVDLERYEEALATYVVNDVRSEQILPSDVSTCPPI